MTEVNSNSNLIRIKKISKKSKWKLSKVNRWCEQEANNNNKFKNMDMATGSGLMEEYDLMKQAKYRGYMSNIDKALKNFEYTSEWADLIPALGKLNKVISSYPQYQIIPRRIKISKRLAQCMHPALPSGVHLKALDTYDVIFQNTGVERLASELFIYSAGLFPLLGYAATNVRPSLLAIYEKYFVPLGERLRPALSGFLSGVLPGLESGLDHFDRTNSLLGQVCNAVTPVYFYTCLWECAATNSSVRLPAITYVLNNFNKKLGMSEQTYLMGKNQELMLSGLCACLNDSVILVQRNTLEFLLSGFPFHSQLLPRNDLTKLVTNALNTILRRDMSLNRRLYSWLLGTEVNSRSIIDNDMTESMSFNSTSTGSSESSSIRSIQVSYFEQYSKSILIKSLKTVFKNSLNVESKVDLRPYQILRSLLDKVELGPVVLDDILCDVIRTIALSNGNQEVNKQANLLYQTFDPSYIWNFMTNLYETACKQSKPNVESNKKAKYSDDKFVPEVDSGEPSLVEVCFLTEFLLETISLEMYNETTRVYLPRVLFAITKILTIYSKNLAEDEIIASMKLCIKIVSRVQPMILTPSKSTFQPKELKNNKSEIQTPVVTFSESSGLEKSKSDSRLNQICADTGQLIVNSAAAVSTPNLDVDQEKSKGKKKLSPAAKFKTKFNKKEDELKTSGDEKEKVVEQEPTKEIEEISVIEQPPEHPVDMQEYTILEKCIKQYEIFYQSYFSFKLLGIEQSNSEKCPVRIELADDGEKKRLNYFINDQILDDYSDECAEKIDLLFETLKIKENCRLERLHSLLNQTINDEFTGCGSRKVNVSDEEKIQQSECLRLLTKLINLRLNDHLRESVKLASALLVEMSTFPNYNQDSTLDFTEVEVPAWFKVLLLVAAYSKSDKELQISSISTTIELLGLLKSQMEHSTNPGVQFIVMLPLLKFGHVGFLENKTRVFQVLISSLWDYLDDRAIDLSQISSLLYQLHNCLESGLVERVIDHRMENVHLNWSEGVQPCGLDRLNMYKMDRLESLQIVINAPRQLPYLTEKQSSSFKKFELLWHLGRDLQNSKSFDRILLKVFDGLGSSHQVPWRTFIVKWLKESLLRGDLPRLLKPLLKILLAPDTKRISISNIQFNQTFDEKMGEEEVGVDALVEKDVYAVSSEGGNIKYHLESISKKKSPIRNLQKKFFGVSIGLKNQTKISNYISEKTGQPTPAPLNDQAVSMGADLNNISLIINPLDQTSEFDAIEPNEFVSKSAPTSIVSNDEFLKSDSSSEYSSTCLTDDLSEASNLSDDGEKSNLENMSITTASTVLVEKKKFTGILNDDLLTEHDKTKNRKTYYLGHIDTSIQEMRENTDVSQSVLQDQSYDESTPAEEYFCLGEGTEQIVENVIRDMIENAIDEEKLEHDVSEDSECIKDKVEKSVTEDQSSQEEIKEKSDDFGRLQNIKENLDEISEEIENCEELEKIVECKVISENFRERETRRSKEFKDNISEISGRSKESTEISSKVFEKRSSKTSIETQISSTSEQESDSKKHLKRQKNVKVTRGKTRIRGITKETLEKGKINKEILRKNIEKDIPLVLEDFDKMGKKGERWHPFHTHLLLYTGCFDSQQVLYSFETLRNLIVSCDSKLFLCLSITTAVSQNQLKQLLIRHRKSIFGKGYFGSLTNNEFNNAYRGVMYLEVLITICLYYARSYYKPVEENCDSDDEEYKMSHEIPKLEDFQGNCKIQLASIELLTLIFHELIGIVKEMGKGLANYVVDLLSRCKVQKVVLHCVLSSVHLFTMKSGNTLSEKILKYNDPQEKMHLEAIQVQLLRLLHSVIKLEYEAYLNKGEESVKETTQSTNIATSTTSPSILSQSPTRPSPIVSNTPNLKYQVGLPISQQPMFLTAILNALQAENLKHLHKNWTDLVTSSLNCFSFGSLTNIVISVVHQICTNLDKITKSGNLSNQVPPDYCVAQLEALTVICHYCLLDNTQQVSLSNIFNPQNSSLADKSSYSGQIYNNIMNFFLSTSSLQFSDTFQKQNSQQMATRNCVLSHLPRIVASVALLWETEIGQSRLVKQQLLEFLSPISLHHGCNFLAAISVAWQERGQRRNAKISVDEKESLSVRYLPQAVPEQLSLVKLITGIRIIPTDSFVQTLHSVIKSPPQIYRPPPGLVLDVSALELFYFYMKTASAPQLADSWNSLLNLLKDGLSLSPPAQFVLLSILNEFVQRCQNQMPFPDKKDMRDLHDITSRLVDALSIIAGSNLEQTTWLRRNLAVKQEEMTDEIKDGMIPMGNQQYSVQAQSILAIILAPLLDVAYGSQEKDKVIQIVTTLMYNIVPYLKNHTSRNVPSFYACSNLLASLGGYQYTKKAWRKDVLELVLDPAFFQMDASCLPFWKQIVDNLMTCDIATFRDLMNRLSIAQTGSLNIFTSKEQEYEQRALLLKRLAFVIFCSEKDQYHKFMPEIQEQLANSLRLPQVVPSVQAAVFLCFRVLLLRMSPDHVTSLWPIIIAEMVQVFLAIEQELMTDTEEFSQHIRMLSGLDSSWITNSNNGLHSHGHPHWRMVQLETAKLLELGCVLPAVNLPHFQMYRWAFVGSHHDSYSSDIVNGDKNDGTAISIFIPHVTRIARLMDFRYTSHSPKTEHPKGTHLVLTCQSIGNLQDLYGFFSTLCIRWPAPHHFVGDPEKDVKHCLAEIEHILSLDFLEKMPTQR